MSVFERVHNGIVAVSSWAEDAPNVFYRHAKQDSGHPGIVRLGAFLLAVVVALVTWTTMAAIVVPYSFLAWLAMDHETFDAHFAEGIDPQ